MKKFLVYLVVILVAVSVGFTVFYLVRDNETISISTSSIYMREGDVIDDLGIVYNNKKSFSDYEVFSSNDNIAKYDKDKKTLTGVSGGIATITFRTTNAKFRNLSCQVYVGNGTITSPYYIQTASELRDIGAVEGTDDDAKVKYGLDKCYKLVNNINLADGYNQTGYWLPIGTGNENGFTGNFDGNGYTISNININKQKYVDAIDAIENFVEEIPNCRTFVNAGLFSKIGPNGRVCNLKIDNYNISGEYSGGHIGTVAGANYGTIERVEVLSAYIDTTNNSSAGGIAGTSVSMDTTISVENEDGTITNEYVRYISRIDRCATNVNLGISKENESSFIMGLTNYVGGIVGSNYGGIIIYSYSKGEAYLCRDYTPYYGGIVGYNSFTDFQPKDEYVYPYAGGNIKDCYTLVKLRKIKELNRAYIGGIAGYVKDRTELDSEINSITGEVGTANRIMGNYYLASNLNYAENGGTETNYTGIGKYCLGLIEKDYPDKKYVVMGKTESELKLESTYISHEKIERVKNEQTGEYEIIKTEVPWKFGTVWYFNESLNDGYPVINYANIPVSDDFDKESTSGTITNVSELQNMKPDGNYILSKDIVFGEDDVWTPIGTKNVPFRGSLKSGAYINKDGNKDYYKIYNLKTTKSTNEEDIVRGELPYAGLFGVTSGASGGFVQDITLVNPFIVNGKKTGGIVGSNGCVDNGSTSYKGMTIDNCHISGGTLMGTLGVGGIAGDNFGTIKNCYVEDYEDKELNRTGTTIKLYGSAEGYAGGIAGYNATDSTIANSMAGGIGSVVAESGQNQKFIVHVGGIAGKNDASINNCRSSMENGLYINNLQGYIGGVVGTNQGSISNVLVSNTSVNASVENSEIYAGGIVGTAISQSSISNVLVELSSIRGYNAGGLAGRINYSRPNGARYEFSAKSIDEYQLGKNEPNTFSICGVNENVAIEGKYAGGFSAVIDNGIIRNSYTRAVLRGVDSGSIKAGFAVDFKYTPSTGDVGIIINCYSTCTFDSSNGKNYAVAKQQILQNPAVDFGIEALKRDAGYCFNYAYAKREGAETPIYKDSLYNLFSKDPSGTNESDLKGTSPKHLTSRGFDDTIWKFNKGALPTLHALDNLSSNLSDAFDRKVSVSISSNNVKVTCNGKDITNGSLVSKGDILNITIQESEKYEMSSLLICNAEYSKDEAGNLRYNFNYVVGGQDVIIKYFEKQVKFDIEFVSSDNGRVSNNSGLNYAKVDDWVFLDIIPNAGYDLENIHVVTASGKELDFSQPYILDSKARPYFIMVNENVKITATFVPTRNITKDKNVILKTMRKYGNKESLESLNSSNKENRVRVGEEVTIVVPDKTGYEIDTVTVTDVDGNNIQVNDNKFVMPDKDVTIVVTYKRYGVAIINQPTTTTISVNGVKVEANEKILEGSVVNMTITPETGYVIDTISVVDSDGNEVIVNGTTFVMPDKDVTINVTFVPSV